MAKIPLRRRKFLDRLVRYPGVVLLHYQILSKHLSRWESIKTSIWLASLILKPLRTMDGDNEVIDAHL